MTLSSYFNSQVKTECGIKVGTRKKSDGSTIHVRAGKVMSRFWADGSRDKYGAEKMMKAKQEAAAREQERRNEQARTAHTMVRKGASPRPL